MSSKGNEYRRAGVDSAAVPRVAGRWRGNLLLVAATVVLLTISYAPLKLYFLAFVGLVPLLLLLRRCETWAGTIFWSWLTGSCFFLANMWWLAKVTQPGMAALMIYLGVYWTLVAVVLRIIGVFKIHPSAHNRSMKSIGQVLAIAVVFTGVEWLRGNWSLIGNEGLPWQLLGVALSPRLELCQIADIVGVAGVTFFVAAVNGAVALGVIHRSRFKQAWPSLLMVISLGVAIWIYGVYRMGQPTGYAGPTVLVVQPNYPQDNSTGEKGAPIEDIVNFHLRTTQAALEQLKAAGTKVDLVVWSETMMPMMNAESREFLQDFTGPYARAAVETDPAIRNLAFNHNVGLLVGGAFGAKWDPVERFPRLRHNTAYYYLRTGPLHDEQYHKVHLVPFGEFIPFREQWPWMYRQIVSLGPARMEDYELARGDSKRLPVFELSRGEASGGATSTNDSQIPWRFVSPICFEDIDTALVARMFRSSGDSSKRADFLVNITNDGWFIEPQLSQHLQHAIFRSIENRVPTARAVNTGISGFIDAVGRTHNLVSPHTEGWSVGTLMLDTRTTFYTRAGEVFAQACAIVTALLLVAGIARHLFRREPRVTI